MKVKLFVRGVIWPTDIIERTVDIYNGQQYDKERRRFARQIGVDISRVQDDIDPVDYIDLFGVTFFGDRED